MSSASSFACPRKNWAGNSGYRGNPWVMNQDRMGTVGRTGQAGRKDDAKTKGAGKEIVAPKA